MNNMDKSTAIAPLVVIANVSVTFISGHDEFEECMLHTAARQLQELSKIYITREETHINGETICKILYDTLKHLDTDKSRLSLSHKSITLTAINSISTIIKCHS